MLTGIFHKINVEARLTLKHWLFISCIFSCIMICARAVITNHVTYLFLIWNLFLAFIPYAISEWLYARIPFPGFKWKRALAIGAWLLFIPNAFYIVTDLFHLEEFDSAPKWFDLLLLFSFSWNGLLLGIISVRKMELIARVHSGKILPAFLIAGVMWLNALGIYIGRYLRYNSWDIITQPFSLFGEIFQLLIHPFRNSMQWGMIATWTVFMTLFYFTIKKLSELRG